MDPATPYAQRLQAWHAFGLGFTPFAHHYLGHLLRFLFLRLLRCFTSPGCRPRKGRMDCSMQVSPFRYPRITGCLLLPAAFRSWLRLSSASGAKAFPACPLYLNLINPLLTLQTAVRRTVRVMTFHIRVLNAAPLRLRRDVAGHLATGTSNHRLDGCVSYVRVVMVRNLAYFFTSNGGGDRI